MKRARFLSSQLLLLTALSSIAFATGCTCDRADKPKEEPAKVEPQAPQLPPDVDEALLKELEKAATGCESVEGQARINCQGGDKNAIILSFNKGERKRIASLPTFVHALTSADKKLNALAASVLYASFRTGLDADAKKESVSKKLAQELIEASMKLPDPAAMQAIPVATHVAMLSGQSQLLYDALEKDVAIQVKTMSYRYMMVYGRLPAFEKIRELSKDPGAAVVLAAIESPRNMADWTKEEQSVICPWAEKMLDDTRPPVAGNAAAVLGNCAGAELDTMLDKLEQVLKDNQFSFLHATALRDICGEARKQRAEAASDEQCEKVRKLQELAVRDEDIEGRVRAMALSTMAFTWPDERSHKLAKTFAEAKDQDVARTAQQIVTRLAPQLDAAKKSP